MKLATHVVALALLATGCASTQLTEAGRLVTINKRDPPSNCKDIGSVGARTAYNLDGAKNIMRNKAAAMGANYVRWDAVEGEYHLIGTAFLCSDEQQTAPQSEPEGSTH